MLHGHILFIDGFIGPSVNVLSVFVYRLLVAPTTNAVKDKVMNKLKLGSGCCAVGCNVSHSLIY